MLWWLYAALLELYQMLRFFAYGMYYQVSDRTCRGRAAYGWQRRRADMLARTYPHMEGRWAVVTGSNSGIGYEAALLLARCGVSVVLACRSDEKGAAAQARIRAELGGPPGARARVEYVRLDVADLGSVTQFAAAMKGRGVALLVCNAGAMCLPWGLTPQGFERVFGAHVMGHALLAQLMLPELLRCARHTARIVHTSSRTVEQGSFLPGLFARPECAPAGWDRYQHYPDVKTTQTCCALALADELGAGDVAVHAVHPGCVVSDVIRKSGISGGWAFREVASLGSSYTGNITAAEAASYVVRACIADDCAPSAGTGKYFHCGQPGIPGPVASQPAVRREAWRLQQQVLRDGGWVKAAEPRGQ